MNPDIAKNEQDSRKDRAEKIRLLLLKFEKQHEDIVEIKTEALAIAKIEIAKLLPVQLEKDQLLTDLLNEKITLLSFVRAWDKLATKPTTEKSAKPEMTASPSKDGKSSRYTKVITAIVIGSIIAIATLTHDWQFEPNPNSAEKSTVQKNNVIEPEMVAIKGGCFMMGSPDTENGRQSDEKQHQVCVKDFEIGKYEVTQAQWQAVMGNNPSFSKGDNLPVEQVSYDDVQEFINKLNAQTGQRYRLPTEAEWEYAARAGTTTPFYTGECISTNQANYYSSNAYDNCGVKTGGYEKKTVAVGSYPANPWGLYDMAGNIWEWTCSAYVELYDGSETKCSSNNDANILRVLRGGGWNFLPQLLRSAWRSGLKPFARFYYIGFRLSRM